MTSDLTQKRALQALPYLIRCAQKRTAVTYTVLGDYLGVNPHTVLPHILGFIRDKICAPRGLPRINAIVVNKDTGEPGKSFVPEGTKNLTQEEKTEKFRQLRDEAFLYPEWDALLEELNLTPILAHESELDQEAKEYNQVMIRRGGECGEGTKHLELKNYIARRPDVIGISALKKPQQEHLFLSGDICDILIQLMDLSYAIVEIKVGERGELVKGIYQLVKYRALLQAEQGHGAPVAAPQVHLVAYKIPDDIADFARKFNINCHIVSLNFQSPNFLRW